MKGVVSDKLLEWKNSNRRKLLLIRGARQAGTSLTVAEFSGEHFAGRIRVVDLETRPQCKV